MVALPAADLGIMAEHLSSHEGIMQKLKVYSQLAASTDLREILFLQLNMMRVHVRVMLTLINPENTTYVEVPKLPIHSASHSFTTGMYSQPGTNDQWIAKEAHTTAKLMSNNNFNSALMMRNENARNVHVEMALQQLELTKQYETFIQSAGWFFTPRSSIEEQRSAFQKFLHVGRI